MLAEVGLVVGVQPIHKLSSFIVTSGHHDINALVMVVSTDWGV